MSYWDNIEFKTLIEQFIAQGGLSLVSEELKTLVIMYFPMKENMESSIENLKLFYISCLREDLRAVAVQQSMTDERRKIKSMIHRVYMTIKKQVYASSVESSRMLNPPEGFLSIAQHEFLMREERAYSCK